MSNPNNRFSQGPAEKRLYQQTVNGDTISTATWTISPGGPTLVPQAPSGSTATVLVSAVTIPVTYTLYCHIIGASGQEYDSSAQIVGQIP